MILRALFFIAAVALLAPREPNLGLGRPSMDVAALAGACDGGTCTLDPSALAAMKEKVLAGLIRVKGEIAEAQRERAAAD